MIHRSTGAVEAIYPAPNDWKQILRNSRMSTQELLAAVGLASHPLASAEAEKLFELRVPKPYLERIKHGDPNDPLLLQVMPQTREFDSPAQFGPDPLDEKSYSPVRGIIHKYRNRVLLIATQTCTINCRYCFRRHFPYNEHRQSREEWQEALAYIEQHPEIDEVILSGGDPMVLDNNYLGWLIDAIAAIPQVARIRIHSRLLAALPQRIDDGFLHILTQSTKPIVVVLHCNHANEIDDLLHEKLKQLRATGAHVLNQSVLLKGVNDNADTLANLSRRLFDVGVMPYYLFLLDKVSGASHFEVSAARAKAIHQELAAMVSGFLLPKLMVEIPGHPSKTFLR